MISEEELKKIFNPEEAGNYMELMKKALAGMVKDQEENAALREKYAKESKKNPMELMNRERYYRIDLHLKGPEAMAVIKLLEGFDRLTKGE